VISPKPLALAVLLCAVMLHAQPATLNRHPVNLDRDGKLLSWVRPQSAAYDQVMRRAWDFLLD